MLFVYTWDLALAILALFVTLAPFAGAVQSSSGAKALPIAAQIIEAVSYAAFAATLIILGVTAHSPSCVDADGADRHPRHPNSARGRLGSRACDLRQQRGIRRAPRDTASSCSSTSSRSLIMTDRRVVAWYDRPSAIPVYVWATLGIWVGGSGLNIVLDAVFH